MLEKKGRGRPKGSEKDDGLTLAAIAKAIVAEPRLRPTTAMRRCHPKASEADIRRWQAKWKERKDVLFTQAAHEEERQTEQSARSTSSFGIGTLPLAAMGFLGDFATMRIARGVLSPEMKAIMDFQNTPEARLMREIQNNPAFRIARELQSNPMVRMAQARQILDRQRKFGG